MDEYDVRNIIHRVKEEEFSVLGCGLTALLLVSLTVAGIAIVSEINALRERVSQLESQIKK